MRLGISIAGTDRGESGIGTYVRAMVPRLARALEARGGTTSVFGTNADLAAYADVLEGTSQRRLPDLVDAPLASAAYHLTAISARARREGCDVLLLPAANRRMPLRAGLPVLGVVHDLAQLRVPGKYDALRMAYVERLVLPALARASRLVAVSEATRRDLADALGCALESIEVVSNGVDVDRFRPLDPAIARATLRAQGLEPSGPYVLYVSRLEAPGKNHLRLVEAFARSTALRGHELVLAGKDWGAESAIRRAATELGVADRVRLLGFVPAEAVPPLIAASDVVAMVGLCEGFGLPALEALAMGRPVVASSTGALPEVTGSLGVLCDPLDVGAIRAALERAVTDGSLREQVALEGPRWAEAHGWAPSAEALLRSCVELAEAPCA